MHHSIPLVVMLLILLAASRAIGELMERFGQLALMGEILAGVILGPAFLNMVQPSPELKVLSDLGVFVLVMLAGMELDFSDIVNALRGRGKWIPVLNFCLPFLIGIAVGRLLGFESTKSIFLGLCIAITALPVAVRILMDIGRLRTETAQRIIGASVLDDTMALLILGIVLSVKQQGGLLTPILITAGKALLFLAAVICVRWAVRYSTGHVPHSRRAVNWLADHLRGRETMFAITLVFVLGFSSLSELIGLHFVVGAFFGAMVLSHRVLGRTNFEEVQKTASGMAMGFLAPIFFTAIGVEFSVSGLSWRVVTVVIATAFFSKVIGGYLGGRIAHLKSEDSLVVGFGLNGRGIMELVIANLALSNGFIDKPLFSTLVLMGIVTTMATPVLLRWAYSRTIPVPAETPSPLPAVDITKHGVEADPETWISPEGEKVVHTSPRSRS